MKKCSPILFALLLIFVFGCSSTNYVKQGRIVPRNFYHKTSFKTAKTIMLIPFEFEGATKNFLFDTGAELSVVQRDSIRGKVFTIRGASNRRMENGSETVKSFKIGEINFVNIFANNGDLVGLKEQIPDFGGVVGRNIINKANWLIDYPNKTVEISNQELSDDSFQNLPMDPTADAPIIFLNIDGQAYKVIIDLGSSSTFNVPQESELAEALLRTVDVQDHERERYTVGGLQTITEKIGVVPLVTVGDMAFENVKMNINVSSQPRIGMSFFENCIVYIDNTNGLYRIKQVD